MKRQVTASIILLLTLLLGACAPSQGGPDAAAEPSAATTALAVHVLDVGKADCILITSGEHAMLVDAGLKNSEDEVRAYLVDQGVTGFEYVVATHPDKDHIGGMYWILEDYSVGTLLMPRLSMDSKPYSRMMSAFDQSNAALLNPTAGYSFELGETHIEVLSPTAALLETEDENNCSIVLRLTHGNATFLLTGDAQEDAEKQMLANGQALTADVLKVGHHGSNQSTTSDFLNAVNPKLAVISCGPSDDDYYPAQSTIDALTARGIPILRTDINGNILITTDGATINYSSAQSTAYSPAA